LSTALLSECCPSLTLARRPISSLCNENDIFLDALSRTLFGKTCLDVIRKNDAVVDGYIGRKRKSRCYADFMAGYLACPREHALSFTRG